MTSPICQLYFELQLKQIFHNRMIQRTFSRVLAVFSFSLIGLTMSVVPSDQCPLWSGSTQSIEKCFKFFPEAKNWTDAQAYCEALPGGGTLAQFTPDTDLSKIIPPSSDFRTFGQLGYDYGVWFGANDIKNEGVWRWADQTPANLGTMWNTGEPNNLSNEDCAELLFYNLKANDKPCEYLLPFVCMRECPWYRWGKNCVNSCNSRCRNSSCHITSGICDGCEDGYTGDNCDQACPMFYWGENCSKTCSGHCVNQTCDRFNGTCDKGCQAEYLGNLCNETCEASQWGAQCKNNCSGHCLNGSPCNITNGWCDDGCEPGYTQENCSLECPALRWGDQCLNICSDHCNNKTCDYKNGICDHECKPGYFGLWCQRACPMFYWGENCSKKCSDHCVNQTCDIFNGFWDKACQAGYLGNLCNETCEASKWGAQCQNNCSGHCLIGSPCNITNGWCDDGCEPGYTQENCSGDNVYDITKDVLAYNQNTYSIPVAVKK